MGKRREGEGTGGGGGAGREEGCGQSLVGSIGRQNSQLPSDPGRETLLGKAPMWGSAGLGPGGHLASASLSFLLSKVGVMMLGS